MSYFIVYSTSGQITGSINCPDVSDNLQSTPTGFSLLKTVQPANFQSFSSENYVNSGAITQRTTPSIVLSATTVVADGIATVNISGIPTNSKVVIFGALKESVTVTDGELVLTTDTAGVINVVISNDPTYVKWTGTINATAP